MFGRGRVRAPVSLLTAMLLGLGLAGTAQAPALALQQPAAHSAAATAEPAKSTAGSAATDVADPAPAGSATDKPATPPSPRPSPPKKPLPKKFAQQEPNYVPAGCNTAAPAKNTVRCDADVRTDAEHHVLASADGPPSTALTPADVQAAYDLPDGGQGQTVAIVDAFGYSAVESDLAAYRTQFGLPACTTANGCLRKVDQRGGTDYPADDADWAEETALDVDSVSAACPQCHILLVEADSALVTDLGTATQTAVSLGAKFVSNSYSSPNESPSEASNTSYQHPGVVIAAATGDVGNVVGWPGDDPDVIAVGGTALAKDPSTSRGWTENAWDSGGSGCSLYEPQPAYQADLDTDCAHKATADISAAADPNTGGLAIFDTAKGGWLQVGGTSEATPLVTAMYALAGAPASGTFPVTYPYADQGNHLNDVTTGTNGTCGDVLCESGTGWDGPTGLGSPNGVSALTMGPHGTVEGKITDSAGGTPVAGASIVLTDPADKLTYHAKSAADGTFDVTLSAGTYSAQVTAYGYGTGTLPVVTVASGDTATADVSLVKVPSTLLSGKVTDASGHGWPLYAKITIDGYPNGSVYTDPKTGTYSVELPDQADYTLHVTPVYPGYGTSDSTVHLGTTGTTHNIPLSADRTACVAPGYAYPAQVDFENWSADTPGTDWSVTGADASHAGWEFDDPNQLPNLSGGTGNFATADPYDHGGAAEDTDLTTPTFDLSGQSTVHLQFDAAYIASDGSHAGVEASTDGGKTWAQVWQATPEFQGHVDLPLSGPALQDPSHLKFRFHYDGSDVSLFQLDNVVVGSCSVVPGGLVEGTVSDANTHQAVNGATVTDKDDPAVTTAGTATPDDTALGDGFYWLFDPAGKHTYTAAAPRYATATQQGATKADTVTKQNITLQAGQLKVSPTHATLKEELGRKSSSKITLTNTGGAPLHVSLGEQSASTGTGTGTASGADAARSSAGAPLRRVKGTFTTGPVTAPTSGQKVQKPAAPAVKAPPTAGAWQALTPYPEPVMDNAVATYEGRTYSVGGIQQIRAGVTLADGYVYDPSTSAWSAITPLPQPLEAPAAAFVGGTMYVVGGWNGSGNDGIQTRSTVYAYHPGSDTWTRVSDLPVPLASSSAAVYGGDLYVVGGTNDDGGTISSAVYRYDPAKNTWSRVADYPTTVQWGDCGATASGLVCAGGATMSGNHTVGLSDTYLYDAASDTWTRAADAPYTVWGAASSAGNGELQLVGGVTAGEESNSAIEYDPVTNTWSALPNANVVAFRGGGSGCGLTQVGGSLFDGSLGFPVGTTQAQTLPGYDSCAGGDIDWLSENKTEADVAPGHSITVRVTADASVLSAPGDYAAALSLTTDAPYATAPVAVTTKVTAPANWSEISGQVTDAATAGPLAGATVTVCDGKKSGCAHPLATVSTDKQGGYDLWLKPGSGQLTVTASAAGYADSTGEVTTKRGSRKTLGLRLSATS